MKEVKLSNMPTMTVGEVVNTLSLSYTRLLQNKIPLATMPSVMLWGAPGVGKSQAVRQIAKELESETGKKTKVTDVRLMLFNPIDLRGIPTANADKTLAVWLRPKIFDMDPSEDVVNILFLDEISAAPQSVQAAAYQITLDRIIGEHKLPENCIVICAGNRVTDKSVAYKMPKALANRLMHIEVNSDFQAWKEWAIRTGIHPYITGFLSFRQEYLMGFDSSNDDLAFPTPRTWEMVSNILTYISDDVKKVYPQIAGIIGTGCAIEFKNWVKIFKDLPDIESIFKGKCNTVPRETDKLYALTSSMTAYARNHKNDLNQIANSIEYSDKLPPDFAVLLIKDYLYIEKDYKKKLLTVPQFAKWLTRKGALLNGII